jgi:hypothetical protein
MVEAVVLRKWIPRSSEVSGVNLVLCSEHLVLVVDMQVYVEGHGGHAVDIQVDGQRRSRWWRELARS